MALWHDYRLLAPSELKTSFSLATNAYAHKYIWVVSCFSLLHIPLETEKRKKKTGSKVHAVRNLNNRIYYNYYVMWATGYDAITYSGMCQGHLSIKKTYSLRVH